MGRRGGPYRLFPIFPMYNIGNPDNCFVDRLTGTVVAFFVNYSTFRQPSMLRLPTSSLPIWQSVLTFCQTTQYVFTHTLPRL
jgi:hypothetical protein